MNLKGRSFLTLSDYSSEEIQHLLQAAHVLKQERRLGLKRARLSGHSIVLIFDKPSTRTRCAFETAIFDEGGSATYLSNAHLGHKESLEDSAHVLGRFYHGIAFRGFAHQDVECLARYSGVPVWNGLTDLDHPTQALADLMTIQEYVSKSLKDIKLVFVGDGRNNVARALAMACAKTGISWVCLGPEGLWPDPAFLQSVREVASSTGAQMACHSHRSSALEGADVIYTDVWVSMGEESQFEERIEQLQPYQVDRSMMQATLNPHTIFMHCLPAFHDTQTEVGREIAERFGLQSMEVTDEVFRSAQSKVWDQSENRLHTIKSVMLATLLGEQA